MYKLYFSPFSCSFAVHIALEKIGVDFELEKIDIRQNMHLQDGFLRINRRGKVPVLEDGGQFIDQGAGILMHLAEKHPDAELMPSPGSSERAGAISALFYMSNTVHPTMAIGLFPHRYSDGDSKEVLSRALERIKDLLAELDQDLEGRNFLSAEQAYAGDYYLAAALNWLQVFKISLDAYPNLRSYKQRMIELPELKRAFKVEMSEF